MTIFCTGNSHIRPARSRAALCIALLAAALLLAGCKAPRKGTAQLPERPTYLREATDPAADDTAKPAEAPEQPQAAPAPDLVTRPDGMAAMQSTPAAPLAKPDNGASLAPPALPSAPGELVVLADGSTIEAPTRPQDQFAFALALLQGADGQPDPARAVPWLEKSAAQDFGPAQDVLARMYLDGTGVRKDEAKAFSLALSAAGQDVVNAQALVGVLYTYGRGTRRDFAQGEKWLSLAAERGHPQACDLLAEYYRKGLAGPENQKEAFLWTQRAAAQGVVRARFWLGVHYRYGLGVERDDAKALQLLREAADAGNPEAMGLVGEMLYKGQGTKADIAGSAQYFTRGAQAGDLHSQLNLGILHHEGTGVAKDFTRSLQLFGQCAEGGHPRCMTLLGTMMNSGEGTPADPATAHSWLTRALLFGDPDAAPVAAELQQRLTPDQLVHSKNIAAQWMQAHPQFQPAVPAEPDPQATGPAARQGAEGKTAP